MNEKKIDELAELIYQHSPMSRDHSKHLAEVLVRVGIANNATTTGEWISVEVAQPKESGKYIVCNKSGVVYQATYYTYPTGTGGQWGLKDKGGHIAYWMPIPEAPKKEGADNESIH